jgi:hypothetical protein
MILRSRCKCDLLCVAPFRQASKKQALEHHCRSHRLGRFHRADKDAPIKLSVLMPERRVPVRSGGDPLEESMRTPTRKVIEFDQSRREAEHQARQAWKRKYDTAYPGLREMLRKLILERIDERNDR